MNAQLLGLVLLLFQLSSTNEVEVKDAQRMTKHKEGNPDDGHVPAVESLFKFV